MLTHLQLQSPDETGIAAFLQAVAEAMQHSTSQTSPAGLPRFELTLSGPDQVTPPSGSKGPNRKVRGSVRLAVSARNLESAIDSLHDRSGFFVCRTRGVISGVMLEVALMADHHVMHPRAVLVPSGLFDAYVPRLSGWSRLIERTGPGRASSILLSRAIIDAGEALMNGLCERLDTETDAGVTTPGVSIPGKETRDPLSATAARLAHEISERTTRTGGMTPRQTRLLENAAFALAFSSDDPREGIAAFFSNRSPQFASGNANRQDPVKN